MDRAKLEQMSVDELWTLHLEISDALLLLEERLNQVGAPSVRVRPYPPFYAKYRNPDYQHRKQR
jgi:DNA-binding protein H-NS